jgi:hypothetical protein
VGRHREVGELEALVWYIVTIWDVEAQEQLLRSHQCVYISMQVGAALKQCPKGRNRHQTSSKVVDYDLLLVGAVLDLRESKGTVTIWLLAVKCTGPLVFSFCLEKCIGKCVRNSLRFRHD